jgi:lipopolysaccharide assembly protein A
MRLFVWLFRAAIFFTLFAFALNNQQEAAVRWFFGQEWRAPMVFVALSAWSRWCRAGGDTAASHASMRR